MKTITVDDSVWKELVTIQYSMGAKQTISETIHKLIIHYNPTEEEQDGEDDSGDTEDTV